MGNRSSLLNPNDSEAEFRRSYGQRENTGVFNISKETVFINDFTSLLQKNNWDENLYLIIEILERSSQRLATAELQRQRSLELDAFFSVAWTVYQLTNLETRSLNYGTVELNLYEPPVVVPFYDPQLLRPKEGTIKVTIIEPSSV